MYLNYLKDFQVKTNKEIERLTKEKKREELADFLKKNAVANQYCEITDLIPLNMEKADSY
jgi:hypothetical protein